MVPRTVSKCNTGTEYNCEGRTRVPLQMIQKITTCNKEQVVDLLTYWKGSGGRVRGAPRTPSGHNYIAKVKKAMNCFSSPWKRTVKTQNLIWFWISHRKWMVLGSSVGTISTLCIFFSFPGRNVCEWKDEALVLKINSAVCADLWTITHCVSQNTIWTLFDVFVPQ